MTATLFLLFCMLRPYEAYLCSGCSRPYYFDSITGVGACPSAYNLVGSTCEIDSNKTVIIDTKFNSVTSFRSSICDVFSTNSGSFETIGNPFPTLDRGFYFPQNSHLKTSINFIPSPSITIEYWVKALNYGDVVTIDGDTPYLRFGLTTNNVLYIHYRYCNSLNICLLVENTHTLALPYEGSWLGISLYTSPTKVNNTEAIFYLYDITYPTYTFEGENSVSVSNPNEFYIWTVGHQSSGFRGFLYSLKVTNRFQTNWQDTIDAQSCDPFFYLDEGKCLPCSACPLNGMWCIRSSDCSPCYNNFCSSCTGFTKSECKSWTGQCSDGCLECLDYYHCSICHIGYIKTTYKWGTVCKEDLQFNLLSSKLSSFIVSGSNPDTDYTYEKLGGNNPYPLPGRGFYFDGLSYLSTFSKVFIPYTFSVYIWVNPIHGTILTKQNSFVMSTNNSYTYIKSYNKAEDILLISYSMSKATWEYAVIEVYYSNSVVNLKATVGGIEQLKSIFYMNFIDNSDEALIVGSGFIGFIAILGFGSKVHHPDIYKYNYMFQFSSAFGKNFNYCQVDADIQCSVPCTNCDICQDTSTTECFQCPWGYYHSNIACATLSPSAGVIIINGDTYSDLGTCLTSAKGLGCSACNINRVLYENICISSCPTGFITTSRVCTPTDYVIFVQDFSNLLETGQLENISFGSTNTDVYPLFDTNDPLPVHGKGYYFTQTSYMKVANLVFGPEMSIGIWVLIQIDGMINFKGSNYQFSTEESQRIYVKTAYSSIVALFNSYVNSIEWVYIGAKIWFDIGLYLTTVELIYNDNIVSTVNSAIDYFHDDTLEDLVIGSVISDNFQGFTGFLYYIEIYSTSYLKPNLYNQLDCGASPLIDGCLDTCELTEFFDSLSKSCINCNLNCKNGCLRSDDCILCVNPECETCSKINSLVCQTCKTNFILRPVGKCQCLSPYNYNPDDKKCFLCQNPLCQTCLAVDSLTCITCKTNFILSLDGNCECPYTFIYDFNLFTCSECKVNCNACSSSCSLCSGPGPEECITCKSGLFKVEGYCISCPSLSVVANNTTCEVFLGEVFQVNFDTLLGLAYDRLNNVPVITGNSQGFYPEYDSEDPIAAYKRGFYFNGNSSVVRLPEYGKWKSPKLVLSLNWTIEIWLNPKSESGCFFSFIGSDYTLISLCFFNSNISVSINTTLFSTYTFDILSNFSKWGVLMISYETHNVCKLSVFINDFEVSSIAGNLSVVPNYLPNTFFEIGKWGMDYFTGFIYQVSVYSYKPLSSQFYCEGQLIDECLVDCNIEEYYKGPGLSECGACHTSCSNGCRRNDSCSLCFDPLCYECSDFSSGTCSKCASVTTSNGECGCADGTVLDYEVFDCTVCGEKRFYNSFTCVNCSKFCKFCENEDKCLECVDNASIENSKCSCELGFNGTSECNEASFKAQIIVSETNEIYIQFEDILLENLDARYLKVNTSKITVKSVELEQWTSKRYKLKLTYSSAIPKNTLLTIIFKKNIFSIYNSKLSTQILTTSLKSEDQVLNNEDIESKSEATSSSVTVASTAATLSISLLNPNPACMWSYINTIQMLCFISLSSIPLRPMFSGYLKGLRKYNIVPNIFSYFVPHTEGKKPFNRAYEFGYKDHLLLFNIGNYITAFLIMLSIFIITYILSKLTKFKPFSYDFLKKRISSSLANYKYGSFIRFWITCYLDVFASALIGVTTTENFDTIGNINLFVCIIFIVFFI